MLWWPTTESVAFKETCWWDSRAAVRLHEVYCIGGPLRVVVATLSGGQTSLTLTRVVIFFRFESNIIFFFPICLVFFLKGRKLCGDGRAPADRYRRCADEEGDKGWPSSQPKAQKGVHGQAKTSRQVGAWFSVLMVLWLGSKVKKRGKGKTSLKAKWRPKNKGKEYCQETEEADV